MLLDTINVRFGHELVERALTTTRTDLVPNLSVSAVKIAYLLEVFRRVFRFSLPTQILENPLFFIKKPIFSRVMRVYLKSFGR